MARYRVWGHIGLAARGAGRGFPDAGGVFDTAG